MTTDWSKWEAPNEGDVRSPCPMINALANHHVLPHDGKGITKEMAVNALVSAINLDKGVCNVFASGALMTNPDSDAHSFDLSHLSKHGVIEHDVSLTRNDIALGSNTTFNKEIWDDVLKSYGDRTITDFHSASKARYDRVIASKKAHEAAGKQYQYGIKEFILSYGETALLLGLLGDPKDGKIPIQYIKTLVEEERLPYEEGWRPSPRPITQSDMNHLILSLVTANDKKAEEASEVGMGTIHAATTAVTSLMPHFCTII